MKPVNTSSIRSSNENSKDEINLRASGGCQGGNLQSSNSNLTSASSTQQNFKDVTNIVKFKNSLNSSTDSNTGLFQLVSQITQTYTQVRKRLDQNSCHYLKKYIPLDDDREAISQIDPTQILSMIKHISLYAIKGKIELEEALEKKTDNQCNDYESSLQKLEAEIREHIRIEQQLKLYAESTQSKYEDCQKGQDALEKSFEELKKKYEEIKNKVSNSSQITEREKKKDVEIESLRKELQSKVNMLNWYEEQLRGSKSSKALEKSQGPTTNGALEVAFNPTSSISSKSDLDKRSQRSVSTFNNTNQSGGGGGGNLPTNYEELSTLEQSSNFEKTQNSLVTSSNFAGNQQPKTEVGITENPRWSLQKNSQPNSSSDLSGGANYKRAPVSGNNNIGQNGEERLSFENSSCVKNELRDSKNQLKNYTKDERFAQVADEKGALNQLSTIQSLLNGKLSGTSAGSGTSYTRSSNSGSAGSAQDVSLKTRNSSSFTAHNPQQQEKVNGTANPPPPINLQANKQQQQFNQQQSSSIESERGGSLSKKLSDIQSCLTSRQQTNSVHVPPTAPHATGQNDPTSMNYQMNQNNIKLRSSQSFSREPNAAASGQIGGGGGVASNYLQYQQQQQQQQVNGQTPFVNTQNSSSYSQMLLNNGGNQSNGVSKGNYIPRPNSCMDKEHPPVTNVNNMPPNQELGKNRSSISPGQLKSDGLRSQSMDGNNRVIVGGSSTESANYGNSASIGSNSGNYQGYPSNSSTTQYPYTQQGVPSGTYQNHSYSNSGANNNSSEINQISVNNINLKPSSSSGLNVNYSKNTGPNNFNRNTAKDQLFY